MRFPSIYVRVLLLLLFVVSGDRYYYCSYPSYFSSSMPLGRTCPVEKGGMGIVGPGC